MRTRLIVLALLITCCAACGQEQPRGETAVHSKPQVPIEIRIVERTSEAGESSFVLRVVPGVRHAGGTIEVRFGDGIRSELERLHEALDPAVAGKGFERILPITLAGEYGTVDVVVTVQAEEGPLTRAVRLNLGERPEVTVSGPPEEGTMPREKEAEIPLNPRPDP